jgi:hypothetical protein
MEKQLAWVRKGIFLPLIFVYHINVPSGRRPSCLAESSSGQNYWVAKPPSLQRSEQHVLYPAPGQADPLGSHRVPRELSSRATGWQRKQRYLVNFLTWHACSCTAPCHQFDLYMQKATIASSCHRLALNIAFYSCVDSPENLARGKWVGPRSAWFGSARQVTGPGQPKAWVGPCLDLARSPLGGHGMTRLARPDYARW